MIADRTKARLAAAKARGIKLGNAKLAVENQAAALSRAEALPPVLPSLAVSAHKAADTLNGRQIATPTGRPWSAKTVERLAA
jgi:DNA invertase Pin-like site-specific DNA recombinase